MTNIPKIKREQHNIYIETVQCYCKTYLIIIGTFYRLKWTQAPPPIPQQQWLHHTQQLLPQHLYIYTV